MGGVEEEALEVARLGRGRVQAGQRRPRVRVVGLRRPDRDRARRAGSSRARRRAPLHRPARRGTSPGSSAGASRRARVRRFRGRSRVLMQLTGNSEPGWLGGRSPATRVPHAAPTVTHSLPQCNPIPTRSPHQAPRRGSGTPESPVNTGDSAVGDASEPTFVRHAAARIARAGRRGLQAAACNAPGPVPSARCAWAAARGSTRRIWTRRPGSAARGRRSDRWRRPARRAGAQPRGSSASPGRPGHAPAARAPPGAAPARRRAEAARRGRRRSPAAIASPRPRAPRRLARRAGPARRPARAARAVVDHLDPPHRSRRRTAAADHAPSPPPCSIALAIRLPVAWASRSRSPAHRTVRPATASRAPPRPPRPPAARPRRSRRAARAGRPPRARAGRDRRPRAPSRSSSASAARPSSSSIARSARRRQLPAPAAELEPEPGGGERPAQLVAGPRHRLACGGRARATPERHQRAPPPPPPSRQSAAVASLTQRVPSISR